MFHLRHFNTSNVTIQQFCDGYMEYAARISIHLMLLFNEKLGKEHGQIRNFNTSNVTIQPAIYQWLEKQGLNFNTSNVTIQHSDDQNASAKNSDFNTSNVTIQQLAAALT